MVTCLTQLSSPDPCKFVSCENHAQCVLTPDLSARCVCPAKSECPDRRNPVCGSDGVTYGNECHMKADACAKGVHLTVVERKVCGKTGGQRGNPEDTTKMFRIITRITEPIPETISSFSSIPVPEYVPSSESIPNTYRPSSLGVKPRVTHEYVPNRFRTRTEYISTGLVLFPRSLLAH